MTGIGVLVVFASPPGRAQDYGNNKPPPEPTVAIPLTAEEKAALAAVDVRIGGLEALAAKIDDDAYRSSTLAAIADMKKRRASLAKAFDPASYETLMHSVIGRYQVVALWLKPPPLPPPAAKSTAAPDTPASTQKKTETKPASQ